MKGKGPLASIRVKTDSAGMGDFGIIIEID
jgi:hypothetical protein